MAHFAQQWELLYVNLLHSHIPYADMGDGWTSKCLVPHLRSSFEALFLLFGPRSVHTCPLWDGRHHPEIDEIHFLRLFLRICILFSGKASEKKVKSLQLCILWRPFFDSRREKLRKPA